MCLFGSNKGPRSICVASLMMALIGGVPQSAGGQKPSEQPISKATEATVQMNFFNASWPAVLRKVAKATDSELVMQSAPSGHITRRDSRDYTRVQAIQMINREIEPKGFRVLEQGRYLIVIHLDSARARYQRPLMSSLRDSDRRSKNRHMFRQAGFQKDGPSVESGGHASPMLNQPDRDTNATSATTPLPNSVDPLRGLPVEEPLALPVRNRGAKSVARIIYDGLKKRAEFIHTGPRNLPAMRVYRHSFVEHTNDSLFRQHEAQGKSRVQFTIGIDTLREELLIQAQPEQKRRVANLIRLIEHTDTRGGAETRLVATDIEHPRLAQHLEPVLRMMIAQNPSPQVGDSRGQPISDEPPVNTTGQTTGDPLVRLDGLRGPVSIQEVPGIGMVVTGNQDDVDAVMRIIRELERVAAGAEADIHLLLLRHVNSEALADLLNNVYEELTAIRSVGSSQDSRVVIIPVVKPNAVLVLASSTDMQSVLELADKLDQPVDPKTEFEVFSLKSAVATDAAETLQSIYDSDEGGESAGLRSRIKLVADPRTNSLIVQAASRDLSEISRLVEKIDRDSSSTVNRLQVFPLKNAVADELAEVINDSINSILNPTATSGGQFGGGQQGDQLLQAKSVVLEFLSKDGSTQRTIRSGLLADVRVTADLRANSLIVTASEQSMPLMAELIGRLDEPSSTVAEIKVFTLKNSDATNVVELLEALFSSDDEQDQFGIQLAGAEDASSGLVPLRFSVDVRTNSVVGIGGAEALRVVEAIVLRLDSTDVRQRRNNVVRLKNSPSEEVAEAINAFLQSQRDLAEIDPDLVSNVELLEQEIIVVPEVVSNSLLISATPRYYDDIMAIIHRLDESPAQVVIQVLIVEVELQNTDEFGVELGFQDSVLFDRGLTNIDNFLTITESISNPGTGVVTTTERIISQEIQPGFLFNNEQLGNNSSANPNVLGSQGLSSFSLGRVNSDLSFGGLVLSASSESVNVLIRALAAKRKVQILSRPQIRTVDNVEGAIQVGQQVPVISSVTTGVFGGAQPVLGTPQQVGITLQVIPRITPDGVIVMETIASKSAFSGDGIPLLTDPNTGTVVESPIFDLTEARATVAVPDGQTIVLGGMITNRDEILERKVPWLGDIPILGAAFRYDGKDTRRTELLIFMTPRIVRDPADAEYMKQVEVERLNFLECEAEEIHGPLFSVPESIHQPKDPVMAPYDGTASETVDDFVPTTIMPAVPNPPGTPTDDTGNEGNGSVRLTPSPTLAEPFNAVPAQSQ